MKNILKKNQVIITALVIMIAVAGYLNFTQDKAGDLTASTEDAAVETGAADQNSAAADADQPDVKVLTLDDGNEVIDTAERGQEELLDLSAEDLGKDEGVAAESTNVADSKDDTGEAVLVSNTIGADFFASARLTREQTRAKNKEMLMELVNNTNLTEEQKKDAVNNVVDMTTIAEKESSAEILLGAKGFDDVVVNMMNGGVDVIVNAENLTEQQMAQIEDIVKRKTGAAIENIVITPVGVE